MDFKNILNKSKTYVGKVKENISKTIDERDNQNAFYNEVLKKANSLVNLSFKPLNATVLDSKQQEFWQFMYQEYHLEKIENGDVLLSFVILKNEIVIGSLVLKDETNLTTYDVFFTNQAFYLMKNCSYFEINYKDINSVTVLKRGVFNTYLELKMLNNSYVVSVATNIVDTVINLLNSSEKRNEWKQNIQNNYLDYQKQQADINTPLGMEKKVLEQKLNQNKNSEWLRVNFAIISSHLLQDEKVLYPFVGMLNYRSETDPGEAYVFVLTTNRFLFANKGLLGENFRVLPKEQITGITINNATLNGVIQIHTSTNKIIIGLPQEKALSICQQLKELLQSKDESDTDSQSVADELMKLKQLLDLGVINQDEFEKGKNKLLG